MLLALLACTPTETNPVWWDLDEAEQVEVALAGARIDVALSGMGIDQVSPRRFDVDELDQATLRLEQTYDGLRVVEGELIVHLDAQGEVVGMNDYLVPDIVLDTRPLVGPDEAMAAASGGEAQTHAPRQELVVLRIDGQDHVAWETQLYRLDIHSMPLVYVDAKSGEELRRIENLRTAKGTGTSNYSGTVEIKSTKVDTTFYLEDPQRQFGTYDCEGTTTGASYVTDSDKHFEQSGDEEAVDVHYAMSAAWDYYLWDLNHFGIDGSGGPGYVGSVDGGPSVISAFVNYDTNYANAFWSSGVGLFFGDGGGSYNDLTSLDIVAHEYTHGVTESFANFTYSGQSGALDESYADVLGAMAERYADGDSDDIWIMGEDVVTSGDGIRFLDDPTADGVSRSHMDDEYTGSADNGGVHLNSGILNHAFYMMSEGGQHVDYGGASVTGMGGDAAGAIAFRSLKKYMSASSDFEDARIAYLDAAQDLYGADSDEYAAVQDAFSNVGLGDAASVCSNHALTAELPRQNGVANRIYPHPQGYTTTSAGTHSYSLTGDDAADLDMFLYKWNGTFWAKVDKGNTTGTSTETISYSGDAGQYRLWIRMKDSSVTTDVEMCADWPT